MKLSAIGPIGVKVWRRAARSAAIASACLALPCGIALAQSMASPPFDAGGGPGVIGQPQQMDQTPALSLPPALSQPPQPSGPPEGCQENMAKYSERRNAQLQSINALVKGGKGKGIDPVAACPKFRTLVSIESQMRAWAVKNKEWCGIPDQIIDQMKEGFAKTPVYAQRACAAAAQMKRNSEMQAQGGGPSAAPAMKLPSGPL